jgi:pyruvate/2-oxoglutarate dehydrogenase complex dihydrolipoamide dehydrogenase (E3) component
MARYDVLPTGGFTDPDYGQVGLTEQQSRPRSLAAWSHTVPYAAIERAIIDSRTTGLLKLISDPRRETVLGARAVGEDALEVIQAIAAAQLLGDPVPTSP